MLLSIAFVASPHPAAGKTRSAGAQRIVLAPLDTLGIESPSQDTERVRALVRQGLAAVPDVEIVEDKTMLAAIHRERRPELRSCEGDTHCLADLGRVLAASHSVHAEVGGLGQARIVYMKVVDVGAGREIRSTILRLGPGTNNRREARAAAYRLLRPGDYVGHLRVRVEPKGAAVFVDGRRIPGSPGEPIRVPVGTHALRITHPEAQDFVRFVAVPFDDEVKISASLRRLAVVETRLEYEDVSRQLRAEHETTPPWYRRWYAVVGFSATVFAASAVTTGLLVGRLDADWQRTIDIP